MASSHLAAATVTAVATPRWNIGSILSSSSAKLGVKLVVLPSIFKQHPITFSSTILGSSSFKPSRRFSDHVGLQIIACSSPSSVNQISKDSTVHDVPEDSVSVGKGRKEKSVTENAEKPNPSASISSFIADVVNLVKLVDSRDIVELEMKHRDCEIIIRKKEAMAPPPPPASFPGPHVMAHTSYPEYTAPPPPALSSTASAASDATSAAPAASPPAADVSPPSEHPPMLSPMAGTFYRSPGPGEPAFVQIGDKVTKGQVVCIVEAMKLMNEIEADQSGTIVAIVAEDGKPVTIDSPLYVIKP